MRNKELKVRLSEDELDRFSTVCSTEHVPPSTKARELIVEYSQAQLPIQKIESCGATESKEKTACRTAIPQLPDSASRSRNVFRSGRNRHRAQPYQVG